MNYLRNAFPVLVVAFIILSCQATKSQEVSLKEKFINDFLIGGALNNSQVAGKEKSELELITTHFNTITPENLMKWERIHPKPGKYHFKPADQFVEFGEANNLVIMGHTLIWHNQTPDWIYHDDDGNMIEKEELYARMKEHIVTVMGRYKGKITGWDVVNEALNDDGTYRESNFYQIGGKEFIAKAFEYAHEADPEAELYYNDYSMNKADKVHGAIRMADELREQGLRVDGIGMQGHWGLDGPTLEEIENSILAISNADYKVMITELEIDVLPSPWHLEGADLSESFENNEELNPYKNGIPEEIDRQLAERYGEVFELLVKHSDKIDRVTFWGVQDGNSWKNDWPAEGRTNYPLIFDRDCQPKKAFYSVMESAE